MNNIVQQISIVTDVRLQTNATGIMTYATVCSGIEAPSVAWHPLGFDPVFFSEIEKFPSKVLAHHYLNVPNLGDMTKIDGTKYAGTIDLICGGTPCQSFSVAGLRKGMADHRGNLALVFLRLVDQIRPKWVVWENVPGVLSSWSDAPDSPEVEGIGRGNGRDIEQTNDFDTFIAGFRELGYGCAWRILDAQYFGVPQRRRRVFVVAHLGDWRPAAAVLFERESLRWDFKPRKEAGENVAALTANGVGTCGADDNQAQAGHLVIDFINHTVSETCQTLTANGNGPSANNTPYVMATGQANAEILAGQSPALTCNHEAPIVFDNAQITSPQNGSKCEPGAPCPTIAKDSQLTVCFHGSQDPDVSDNVTHPIGTNRGLEACIFQPRFVRNGRGEPSETASALTAHAGGTGKGDSQQCVANGTTVRRITPKEAERLQGFPDNYTNIPGSKDGPRYKALGNSMAVPVMRWIGERIKLVNDI